MKLSSGKPLHSPLFDCHNNVSACADERVCACVWECGRRVECAGEGVPGGARECEGVREIAGECGRVRVSVRGDKSLTKHDSLGPTHVEHWSCVTQLHSSLYCPLEVSAPAFLNW